MQSAQWLGVPDTAWVLDSRVLVLLSRLVLSLTVQVPLKVPSRWIIVEPLVEAMNGATDY